MIFRLERVARQVAPYRQVAAGALALTLAATGLSIVPPALLRMLIDDAVRGAHPRALVWLATGMVVVPALVAGSRLLAAYLAERVSQGVLCDLRQALFGKLQAQSLTYFVSTSSQEIASRLVNDVADLEGWFGNSAIALVADATLFCAALAAMLRLCGSLTLVVVGFLPCLLVPLQPLRKIVRRRAQEAQDSRGALVAMAGQVLGIDGFLLRRSCGSREVERIHFARLGQEFQDALMRRFLGRRFVLLAMSVIGTTGVGVILGLGGHLVMTHALSIGSLLAFVAYSSMLFDPVTGLANAYITTMVSLAGFERLHALCDLEPAVSWAPAAHALVTGRGDIRLEAVSFRYRADQPLLEDVSFEARSGELVALVGPSGAGKTTIGYLLMRFIDPDRGRVTLAGHDLRDLTQESLEEHIGLVPQQVFLYHGTIRENLLVARRDASAKELEDACRRACLHETIAALPASYDTVVGERGYRLSEGEKQRLAIARVMLRAPRILVLDEATSGLDSLTEARVQRELDVLMAGRTTLAIAHRLSTIMRADQILVLDRGRIVERGNHRTLLAQGGLYSRLHRQQLGPAPERQGTV